MPLTSSRLRLPTKPTGTSSNAPTLGLLWSASSPLLLNSTRDHPEGNQPQTPCITKISPTKTCLLPIPAAPAAASAELQDLQSCVHPRHWPKSLHVVKRKWISAARRARLRHKHTGHTRQRYGLTGGCHTWGTINRLSTFYMHSKTKKKTTLEFPRCMSSKH